MRKSLLYKLIFASSVLFLFVACKSEPKQELLNSAVALLNESRPSGAIALLKSALENDQDFFEARHQLAVAYTQAEEYEQAEREFQKVIRMNPSRSDIQLELEQLHQKEQQKSLYRISKKNLYGPA